MNALKEILTEPLPAAETRSAAQDQTIEALSARVGPSVPCVETVGSTAETSPGEVTAAERTERYPLPESHLEHLLDLATRLESTFDPGGNLPEDCEAWASTHQDVIQELRGLAECGFMAEDE